MSKAGKLSLSCGVLMSSVLINVVLCSLETVGRPFRRFATASVPSTFTNCYHDQCATAFVAVRSPLRSQKRYKNAPYSAIFSSSSPPSAIDSVHISIEYCSACQWMLRSSWIAAELLTTFSKESKLASVALVPKSPPLSPGGIFRVVSKRDSDLESTVLWDRSIAGRFPEAKEVKQLVRDVVSPERDLGHSDKIETKQSIPAEKSNSTQAECLECGERERAETTKEQKSLQNDPDNTFQPSYDSAFYKNNLISIEFSIGPTISSRENKLHRAVWYANELLTMVYERNAWWKENQQESQANNLDEKNKSLVPAAVDCVTLIPIRDKLDVVKIQLNDDIIFNESMLACHGQDFNIRSIVAKFLTDGYCDKCIGVENLLNESTIESQDKREVTIEMMSDDDADEARKFFGVF